jgi:hypothetical protein
MIEKKKSVTKGYRNRAVGQKKYGRPRFREKFRSTSSPSIGVNASWKHKTEGKKKKRDAAAGRGKKKAFLLVERGP